MSFDDSDPGTSPYSQLSPISEDRDTDTGSEDNASHLDDGEASDISWNAGDLSASEYDPDESRFLAEQAEFVADEAEAHEREQERLDRELKEAPEVGGEGEGRAGGAVAQVLEAASQLSQRSARLEDPAHWEPAQAPAGQPPVAEAKEEEMEPEEEPPAKRRKVRVLSGKGFSGGRNSSEFMKKRAVEHTFPPGNSLCGIPLTASRKHRRELKIELFFAQRK